MSAGYRAIYLIVQPDDDVQPAAKAIKSDLVDIKMTRELSLTCSDPVWCRKVAAAWRQAAKLLDAAERTSHDRG